MALKKGVQNPSNLVRAFKRDLGGTRRFELTFESDLKEAQSHYIVDTNVFIMSPDILNCFSDADKVYLSRFSSIRTLIQSHKT